jgi:phosphate-selective porin OprO and OprP
MKIRSILAGSFIVIFLVIGVSGPTFGGCAGSPSAVHSCKTSEAAGPVRTHSKSAVALDTTDGFCLNGSGAHDLSLCFGAFLQTDYRYYHYDKGDPAKNKFDIRRAQLKINGQYEDRFDYFFKYEFEGAGSRRLLDAYVNMKALPYASLKVGQFKEPFGLDTSTSDSDLFFAERSMGYYLAPNRDVGVMMHSSLLDDRFWYGVGIFNGDGVDDSVGGNEDALQVAGRLVVAPFKTSACGWIKDLQLGGSAGYANIDSNNVSITAKTAGLTTFYDVATRAKFNIIRDAGDLALYGLELAWVRGPFAFATEYIDKTYNDVETSSGTFDTDMKDYYFTIAWMVFGENFKLKNGVFKPLEIDDGPTLWKGLGLSFRFDRFAADDRVYENLIIAGSSVRKATAYSLAANWHFNRFMCLTLDATRTEFDLPLIIDRDAITGTVLYDDKETVVTGRLSFEI